MAEFVLKLGVKLIAATANDYRLSLDCAFLIIFELTVLLCRTIKWDITFLECCEREQKAHLLDNTCM